MWQMEGYRKFAIDFISTQATGFLSPAQRLSLSITYHVKQWFVPGVDRARTEVEANGDRRVRDLRRGVLVEDLRG